VPDEIASAVREKQQRDNTEVANLISKGSPVAKLNTGIDGGMNRVFAAKLPEGQTGLSDPVEPGLKATAFSPAPGTIPPTVNPPRSSAAATVATSYEPAADATRPSSSLLAPSKPNSIFTNLARKMGFGDADTTTTTKESVSASAKPKESAPAKPKTATTATRSAPPRTAAAKPATPKPAEKTADKSAKPEHVAAARPPLKPAVDAPATASIPSAAPVASSNSFDSRFSVSR
jgi:hypothetical protein